MKAVSGITQVSLLHFCFFSRITAAPNNRSMHKSIFRNLACGPLPRCATACSQTPPCLHFCSFTCVNVSLDGAADGLTAPQCAPGVRSETTTGSTRLSTCLLPTALHPERSPHTSIYVESRCGDGTQDSHGCEEVNELHEAGVPAGQKLIWS